MHNNPAKWKLPTIKSVGRKAMKPCYKNIPPPKKKSNKVHLSSTENIDNNQNPDNMYIFNLCKNIPQSDDFLA